MIIIRLKDGRSFQVPRLNVLEERDGLLVYPDAQGNQVFFTAEDVECLSILEMEPNRGRSLTASFGGVWDRVRNLARRKPQSQSQYQKRMSALKAGVGRLKTLDRKSLREALGARDDELGLSSWIQATSGTNPEDSAPGDEVEDESVESGEVSFKDATLDSLVSMITPPAPDEQSETR